MARFNIKDFANLCTPPSHPLWNDSAFDPGSPQYVRPEDMMLDIQSELFGFPRKERGPKGQATDPADFSKRWKADGAPIAKVSRGVDLKETDLVPATMTLLRCSRRRAEHFPTVLPILPAVGAYKSINPKLPHYLVDQLVPLLTAAGPAKFGEVVDLLRSALRGTRQPDDTLLKVANSLLQLPADFAKRPLPQVTPHAQPLVMDFSGAFPAPLPICTSYVETLTTLDELETKIPRVLWMRWFTAVNRTYLPLFFLQRCSVTCGAARVARLVAADKPVPTLAEITAELLKRRTVLRGSPEMLNQLQPAVQEYVRARIELSVLLHLAGIAEDLPENAQAIENPTNQAKLAARFEKYYKDSGASPKNTGLLAMPGDSGPDRQPLDKWLQGISSNRAKMDAVARFIGANDTPDLIDRVFGELRSDYMPLTNGFGKNAREFVAFMLGAPSKAERDATMPDEFNLLVRGERGAAARQVAVRPGSQLLELLVQLATRQAQVSHFTNAKLGDICDLFEKIGVDFRSEPADFDFLREELLRQGLLESSADAAEAAELKPAYAFQPSKTKA